MPIMTSAPLGMVMIIVLFVAAPLLRLSAVVVFAQLMPSAAAGIASSDAHITSVSSVLISRFFIVFYSSCFTQLVIKL